jgi:hypothetical protein
LILFGIVVGGRPLCQLTLACVGCFPFTIMMAAISFIAGPNLTPSEAIKSWIEEEQKVRIIQPLSISASILWHLCGTATLIKSKVSRGVSASKLV